MPPGAPVVRARLWFGRFLPFGWYEWRGARYAVPVSYLAPGATNPVLETAAIEQREPPSAWASNVTPAVSPPLAPRVGGQDATVDPASAVSTTPTISWAAPAVGAPTVYVVEVWRLDASGPATVRTLVLRHATAATQLTVPPGILAAGVPHYAKIKALVTTAPRTAAPFRRANVWASADALTGVFTP
jgi:hypothetical protein